MTKSVIFTCLLVTILSIVACGKRDKSSETADAGPDVHSISLDEAVEMISAYQNENPEALRAWYFSKAAIQRVISQDNVAGLRIYGALNDEMNFSPVLVAVTPSGNDLAQGELAEKAPPCPPDCATASPLNP